jgi:hypothetical protein
MQFKSVFRIQTSEGNSVLIPPHLLDDVKSRKDDEVNNIAALDIVRTSMRVYCNRLLITIALVGPKEVYEIGFHERDDESSCEVRSYYFFE